MGANDERRGAVIPALRYEDAAAAIEWLCAAFGFERHLVVPAEEGRIAHAQLALGRGLVMLGSVRDDDFGRLQRTPRQVGGVGTQSVYAVVADVDAHHARAAAAGAEVVYGPEDQEYGGRLYTCRDPEGHLWSFGSYDPWAGAQDHNPERGAP